MNKTELIEHIAKHADISKAAGFSVIVSRHADDKSLSFVRRPDISTIAQQGPATPDHVIRTKRLPMLGRDVAGYVESYKKYFELMWKISRK